MFLINNQLYIDLEPYIDMEGLLAIEHDIIYGLTKSKNDFWEGGASYHNFYDPSLESLLNASHPAQLKDPRNPNYNDFKKLNFDVKDCRFFARYLGKYRQMGQVLNLRTYLPTDPKGVHNKASQQYNFDTTAYQHFPSFKEWVNNLKIFSEIGRIIFWLNAPGEPGAIHKDEFINRPDHHMLINLHPDRKDLFILDDEGNKQVIQSRAYVFDGRNFHGTQGKDFYSWTIRIDGVFNKEWAESIGIWDHFDPNKPHEQLASKTIK